jgi:WD40 repeat protein
MSYGNIPRVCGILLAVATAVFSPVIFAEKCGSRLGPLASVLKPADNNAVAVEVATLREPGAEVGVLGLAFSFDSRRLATVSGLNDVMVWDWSNQRLLKKLTVPVQDGRNSQIGWQKWESVLFSPTNQELVACTTGYNKSPGGSVDSIVWDSQTGRPLHELVASAAACSAIAFTRDGSRLLQVLVNGAAFYDATSWTLLWKYGAPDHWPQASAVSPDGRRIAIGTSDIEFPNGRDKGGGRSVARVHILDAANGKELRVLEPFPDPGYNEIQMLAWTPNGTQIAIEIAVGKGPDFDRKPIVHDTVALIDAASGNVISAEESAAHQSFHVLRLTPDGRYLIESGIRDTVEIWDGQHEHLLQEICAQPQSSAVSGDSRYLAIGGSGTILNGGKVIVYKLK